MNGLLSNVITSINLVILQRTNSGKYRALASIPPHLQPLLPDAHHDELELEGTMPFLDNFLEDAEAHWHEQNTLPLRSGPWIETMSQDSNKIALEAIALWSHNESILLIEDLGQKFVESTSKLQAARENLLTNEQLETEVQKRTALIIEREEQIALRLLAAAGYRDEETGAHIRRIGMYSAVIAQKLGWGTQQIEHIRMAAPMHDIGKIGIPDSILQKPSSLTAEEFDVMKQHPSIGADMLANTGIPMMDMASDIARCHHERWDGTGYPNGLHSIQIPESARITTIVDIYDALVHERIYKPAFSEEKTLTIMTEMTGSHLDPRIFEVFLSLLPEMRRIKESVKDTH
jgi:HD-GYP domain-containing protein (c-di-GMP phosphodiesterase class II)